MNTIEKQFKDIKFLIDDKELNSKQKSRFLNLISIEKLPFLNTLLKSKNVKLTEIPGFLMKSVLSKQQNKNIQDLIFKQIKLQFKQFLKSQNGHELTLHDTKRNIIIKTTETSVFSSIISSYSECIFYNQYDVSSQKIKDKIVIDAGSNMGEFAIYCARLGAKKVYAFEPVKETYKILEDQIRINKLEKIVIPVRMALGNENEKAEINFSDTGDGGAGIGRVSSNSETIQVIKLDDFCKEEKIQKIDFIKMDVEGYEENALKGSAEIIKRDKPILSFAAYHKPSDKTILPALVKKIRPDYNITFLKRAEEDFYCD